MGRQNDYLFRQQITINERKENSQSLVSLTKSLSAAGRTRRQHYFPPEALVFYFAHDKIW